VVAIVLAVAMGVETIPAKTEKTKWTTAREGTGGTETTIDVIEVSDAATVTGREIKQVSRVLPLAPAERGNDSSSSVGIGACWGSFRFGSVS
jgi:hypothetical protein